MIGPALHVIVPGALNQRTGGYVYDARIVEGLRRLGWQVVVHELDGAFPKADARARASLGRTLGDFPDGARVLVDGLAMGGLPEAARDHRGRLRILALVHHPLADETGLSLEQRERFAALEREALSACIGVLVTSDFTAHRMAAFGVPPARVRAVVPGTDPTRPAKGPGPGAPPRLLCVASVIPRKGQDVLVRALAQLREASWSCVCAGSLTRAPAYARAVQDAARTCGLDERISFPGECDPNTLDDLYDGSSLFVLPSHYEGYGMALTDALARGLPIVSTTGGAIPHTVPAEAGVLVPPGDDTALAKALGSLLSVGSNRAIHDGRARRAILAAAARRHAACLPDWDRAARAFADATLELAPDGV